MKLTPQKKLPYPVLRDLRWGSHIPLNLSVLHAFPITGILELGAGLNSTSLFFDNCSHVVSVESDLDWINKLINEKLICEDATHKIVHHKVPSTINRSTIRENISKDVLNNAVELYNSVITPDMNYLFVDCFAGFRLAALNNLYQKFDVISYHDAEPHEDKWYGYSKFRANDQYFHFVDRTFAANVGLLVSKKFEHLIQTFNDRFVIEAEKYAKKFNAEHQVVLEKIA